MDLNKCLKDIGQMSDVSGCILVDDKGLCLAATGNASKDSAGVIKAIADVAAKFHPDLPAPVICLESDNKACLIQQQEKVTAAIYKTCPM